MMMDAPPPPPQYTILRIKRKVTEDPLDQLVIAESAPRPKKRSRGDAPPSASLEQQQGKGVFRLAETVPEGWQEKEGGEALRRRIAEMMALAASSPAELSTSPPPTSGSPLSAAVQQAVRYRVIPPFAAASRPTARQSSRRLQRAPVVMATPDPDAPPAPPPLKLLDAHQVLPHGAESSGNNLIIGQEEEDDPQMAAFLPMLRDYLSISNTDPAAAGSDAPRTLAPRPAHGPPDDTTDRYVYDLYFRDATAAVPAGTGATLEGYVPDEGELVASDDEELEEEDMGDEDSNDEDFYRNDYPDEFSSVSEGEDSEDEDAHRLRWEEDY